MNDDESEDENAERCCIDRNNCPGSHSVAIWREIIGKKKKKKERKEKWGDERSNERRMENRKGEDRKKEKRTEERIQRNKVI